MFFEIAKYQAKFDVFQHIDVFIKKTALIETNLSDKGKKLRKNKKLFYNKNAIAVTTTPVTTISGNKTGLGCSPALTFFL